MSHTHSLFYPINVYLLGHRLIQPQHNIIILGERLPLDAIVCVTYPRSIDGVVLPASSCQRQPRPPHGIPTRPLRKFSHRRARVRIRRRIEHRSFILFYIYIYTDKLNLQNGTPRNRVRGDTQTPLTQCRDIAVVVVIVLAIVVVNIGIPVVVIWLYLPTLFIPIVASH